MLEAALVAWVAVGVGVTVLGIYRDDLRLAPAKVLASAGFVAIALSQGALDSGFGIAILVGLALSLVGDALLIGTAPRWFLSGLAVFLAAHVAYVGAFWVLGVAWLPSVVAALAVGVPALWFVGRPIYRAAPGPMRIPLVAYLVTIAVMVTLAFAAAWSSGRPILAVAATLFATSDVFVARQQFMVPTWLNAAAGLPLYYAAQVLLAFSV